MSETLPAAIETMTPAECVEIIVTVGDALTVDQVATLVNRVQWFKDQTKEADTTLKGFMVEWLDQPGRSLEIGTKRYYVGDKKKTVCNDTAKALEALLEMNGGDFEAMADQLSSQPIKHGAARNVLGDELWKEHFTVLVEKDLKTGKPVKQVKEIDERFVGKR